MPPQSEEISTETRKISQSTPASLRDLYNKMDKQSPSKLYRDEHIQVSIHKKVQDNHV